MTKFLTPAGMMIAVLPCNNVDVSERFYARLGFKRIGPSDPELAGGYRMLSNGQGGFLHLTKAEDGWLVPGKNPCGLYLYYENVDALAVAMAPDVLGKGPQDKPWGMYEFAVSDPDQTLVRVGRPSNRNPR
jgi:hypothetical protein